MAGARFEVDFDADLGGDQQAAAVERHVPLAAASGADQWARAAAAPSEQEIAKIRQLINRIKDDTTGLTPHERARIDEAVAVVRKHRAASLGMPRTRPAAAAAIPADAESPRP